MMNSNILALLLQVVMGMHGNLLKHLKQPYHCEVAVERLCVVTSCHRNIESFSSCCCLGQFCFAAAVQPFPAQQMASHLGTPAQKGLKPL